MMVIFAHRANVGGPNPASENSLSAMQQTLELGFGVETDLRRDAENRFYIAHDLQPWTGENDFTKFAVLFRRFAGRPVAMNVKELGYEPELVRLQNSGDMGNHSFYFDFELLEPKTPGRTQRFICQLAGGERIVMASRLSDCGEPLEQCLSIPAQVVWADEFDSLWITREHIEAVHAAGRLFYAISPELHGCDEVTRWRRWRQFKSWGIDGLCTDYALPAREFFLQ
jgi:glycerophosphoryl diester phosphodiesterase